MKCQVCRKNEAESGRIVCSNKCNQIRLEIIKLSNKYTPTNGCDNCWGDLGGECTEKCREEMKRSAEFVNDLYFIIRMSL